MPERWKSISTAEGSCFIDTGIFFAAYNRSDEMNLDGSLVLVSCVLGRFGRVYTSTYVLDETFTLAKTRMGGSEAVRLAESIIGSKKITVVKVEQEEEAFGESLARFKEHSDVRGLSFTDCTTIVLGEKMKISALMSFDRGFKPFVPLLLGEGYHKTLSTEQRDVLGKIAQNLGIKLKFPKS